MKKAMELALTVTARSLDGQSIVNVLIPPSSVCHWCLCLQLLHDQLVESCVLLLPEPQGKVEVRCAATSTHSIGHSGHRICLSSNALDYLRCFFLKYFRDGFAEVDHVDIDDEQHEGGYLTFSVLESALPVSSAEVRKRLEHN